MTRKRSARFAVCLRFGVSDLIRTGSRTTTAQSNFCCCCWVDYHSMVYIQIDQPNTFGLICDSFVLWKHLPKNTIARQIECKQLVECFKSWVFFFRLKTIYYTLCADANSSSSSTSSKSVVGTKHTGTSSSSSTSTREFMINSLISFNQRARYLTHSLSLHLCLYLSQNTSHYKLKTRDSTLWPYTRWRSKKITQQKYNYFQYSLGLRHKQSSC